MPPRRRAVAALLATLAVPAASVVVGPTAGAAAPAAPVSRASAPRAFGGPGPHVVGATSLDLPDRPVLVLYPARVARDGSLTRFAYTQRDAYPPELRGLVPDAYNTPLTFDAYVDAPSDRRGPYPVVLFGHGAGSSRFDNATILTGIASWGYVVVSPQYLEHDRAAITRQSLSGDASRGRPSPVDLAASQRTDEQTMLAALDLVTEASRTTGSVLEGAVDARRVATVGHSMGGGAALFALASPRVDTAVGWAPVGPANLLRLPSKPAMLIGGRRDIAITPARVRAVYRGLRPPKAFVEIGKMGHNGFTDSCLVIRRGGGLIEFARQRNLVAPGLLKLGRNGCEAGDLQPEIGFRVVQHFTVAHLRRVFAGRGAPVGRVIATARIFPGVRVVYRYQA